MAVATDIMNLFLGVKPNDGKSPFGSTTIGGSPVADSGALFADILGMIGNPTLAIAPTSDLSLPASAECPKVSNACDTPTKLSGPNAPVWMLGRPDEFSGAGQPFTNSQLSPVSADNSSKTVKPAGDDRMTGSAELAQFATEPLLVIGVGAQQVTLAEPFALQDGIYEVLDSKVQNGTVDLTLKSPDSGEAIRVSIPLEELMQSSSKSGESAAPTSSSSINARTPLGNTPAISNELPSWFDKLRITEITVENNPGKGNPDHPTKLTFSGAATAISQGLEISVPKSEIKAFRIANLNSRGVKLSTPRSGNNGSPLEFGVRTVTPISRISMVLPRMMTTDATADPTALSSDALGSSDQSLSGAASDNRMSPVAAEQMRTAISTPERVEFGSVRFTLPEKVEQQLVPGGKSVMLKIHPEHLGPARLNLNWGSDGLSARVTVDSPLAQTAIERSLDKLQEQLSQAGIKVDHIGVSLSGGQTRGQFAQGQPQWQRQSSSPQLYFNTDYRAAEYVTAVAAAPAGLAQYIDAQGVNLFA